MDEVEEAVGKVKSRWEEFWTKADGYVKAIEEYDGEAGQPDSVSVSLPRLNGLAQDLLAEFDSMISQLEILIPQLPSDDQVASTRIILDSWKTEVSKLRLRLRNANLKAIDNVRKAARKQRELLLGGGTESTDRRRNLQTKMGMTSAAESITESLRRSRQLMVQEVERSTSTLMTIEESTSVLRKAESEYKGHRSLLMRTRNLLSTMERQDIIYRLVLVVGFLCFSCAVFYVVSKRMGLLKLQRQITASLKAGMAAGRETHYGLSENELNVAKNLDNVMPEVVMPMKEHMHDEL